MKTAQNPTVLLISKYFRKVSADMGKTSDNDGMPSS